VPHATAWPAAERLFRSDPDWRGGDAAYAVGLDDRRALWLFGDSFVARQPGAHSRRDCAMVRNSIALQTGADPASARMEFHWRTDAGGPAAFFAGTGEEWLWPLHGVRTGAAVTLFFTRVVSTGESGPFGFRAVGWTALRLLDVDGPNEGWRIEPAQLPAAPPFPVVVGTAVVAAGDHVHALALREPGDHALFLLRWPRAVFAAGDLRAPEWRSGDGWVAHAALAAAPPPVLAEAAPEFTVIARRGGGFAMVQSLGFGHADVAVRTAPSLGGPWSEPHVVWQPPQNGDASVMTYAGKAHPLADGSWLVTYASNAGDFGRLVADESLYHPHCLRLEWP